MILERFEHRLYREHPSQHLVSQHQYVARAEVLQIHSNFARHAGAEPDARNGHLKCDFVVHV